MLYPSNHVIQVNSLEGVEEKKYYLRRLDSNTSVQQFPIRLGFHALGQVLYHIKIFALFYTPSAL